ncbi:MAG: HEAT repeat domain-containing protein, partial [Planctomycetota bacterium]
AAEVVDPAAVAKAFDNAMGAVPAIDDQLSERKLDKQTRRDLEDRVDALFSAIKATAAPAVARKLAAVAANAELHQQIRQAALAALHGVDDTATMERLVALRSTVEDRQLAKAIDRTLAASDSPVAIADLSQRALAQIQATNTAWRAKSDAIAEKRKTAESLGEAGELAPPQRKQLKQLGKDIDHLNNDMQKLLKEARETVQELGELRGTAAVTALGTVPVDAQMHQELRKSAAEALIVKRDPAMVEPLIAAFTDDEWAAVRKVAAEALGRCRQPEAIAALRSGLTGAKSPLTRQAAARGLAMSRHPEAYALIKQRLSTAGTSRERIMLILSLAATRDPAALETLTGILQDATAALDDRLGAARALALIPTQGARDALTGIMAGDQPIELKRMTLDSLKPMSKADVPVFAPILLEVLAARPQGELLVMAVENLRRCMFGLPGGDPIKAEIEAAILDLIAGSDNNNARKAALNVFKYSDDPAGVVARLETVAQRERNPVMRSFLNRAVAQLKATGQ